jgi:hypothetical protein
VGSIIGASLSPKQAKESFMDKRGRLKGVFAPFPSEMSLG